MAVNSGKVWTIQEDDRLQELVASGAALPEIANALDSVDLFPNSGVATCSPIPECCSVASAPLWDCGSGRERQDDRRQMTRLVELGLKAKAK
jgi:hypothetical protein